MFLGMKSVWLSLHGKPTPQLAQLDLASGRLQLAGAELVAADLCCEVPVSGTVYGTALNFRGALAALGEAVHAAPYLAPPRAPILYIKPRNTWIGHGASIRLPAGHDSIVVGPTLGVVIGAAATRVSAASALEHVAGYVVVNDVALAHSSYYRPAISQQCRDSFCPLGPWLMPRAYLDDPDALGIRVYINDALQLQSSTSQLIRPVRQLLADVSAFMTLCQGDVLLVGLPEGLPQARAGDVVTVEIEGLGRLTNPVVAETPGRAPRSAT